MLKRWFCKECLFYSCSRPLRCSGAMPASSHVWRGRGIGIQGNLYQQFSTTGPGYIWEKCQNGWALNESRHIADSSTKGIGSIRAWFDVRIFKPVRYFVKYPTKLVIANVIAKWNIMRASCYRTVAWTQMAPTRYWWESCTTLNSSASQHNI